jgi:hypothetical protein
MPLLFMISICFCSYIARNGGVNFSRSCDMTIRSAFHWFNSYSFCRNLESDSIIAHFFSQAAPPSSASANQASLFPSGTFPASTNLPSHHSSLLFHAFSVAFPQLYLTMRYNPSSGISSWRCPFLQVVQGVHCRCA